MIFHTHGLVGSLQFSRPNVEGWMGCTVFAQVPGITANFGCSIHRDEVQHLRDQLAAALHGTRQVEFVAWENGVSIKLDMNDMGHVAGKYEFRSDPTGPSLSGSFVADQTYLRPWLNQVDEILAHAA